MRWTIPLTLLAAIACPPSRATAAADEKDYHAWAATDDGKRQIASMTAGGTRLQFRLEAAADDPNAEELQADGRAVRVSRAIVLNERAIAKAEASRDTHGQPVVLVTMTDPGGRILEQVTSKNIDRRLAIVFDGKLLMAPNIHSAIRSQVQITGGKESFTPERVDALLKALTPATEPKK